MRLLLTPHPSTPIGAVDAIEAEVAHGDAGQLRLSYRIRGDIGALRVPAPVQPTRTDELWTHTCVEAFVRTGAGYAEFNFSPSSQWAAYAFDSYRAGMRALELTQPPSIKVQARADLLTIDVVLADALSAAPARLGLSAVIEYIDGATSYWALAHPPGKPDFHHDDGFALELP